MKNYYFLCFAFILSGCFRPGELNNRSSNEVQLERLSERTYVHHSYLSTESFGRVGCNGMVMISDKKAIIVDTPVNDTSAQNLYNLITGELGCEIIGVIATHFHVDCLGGLNFFHQMNIPSYASNATIQCAIDHEIVVPQHGFDQELVLPVGEAELICFYPGEGHTKDNSVVYFPADKVLFGGCLIKAEGAGKGNLADANLEEWPETVLIVKGKFPESKIVIPGHGKWGGKELLDYTVKLFTTGE